MLKDVDLHLVETVEDVEDFLRWLGQRRSALAFDTETTGLNAFEKGSAIRMVQIGDTRSGWAIPWEGYGALALDALDRYDGPIVAHNSAFDVRWLERHSPSWRPWRAPWHRLHDTMIMGHLVDSSQSIGLKELGVRLIDRNANQGEKMLKDAMHKNNWTWATVPIQYEAYWVYSALDVVLTSRLYELFSKKISDYGWKDAYEIEIAVRRVCSKMEENGCPVDIGYINTKYDELFEYVAAVKRRGHEVYGINMTSGQQVVAALQEQGAEFTKTTPKGAPSADKEQLGLLAATYPMAQEVLDMRKAEKLATTYLRNLLEMQVDGIVHPSIKTVGARSGRMCLSETHKLLTKRGVLHINDVKIGDETIDIFGRWTPVREIFRYEDQPTVGLMHRDIVLESTSEHRWVQMRPDGQSVIEPISSSSRDHALILYPQIRDTLPLNYLSSPIALNQFTRFEDRSNVWCIRTDSGTFTAVWEDRPYLTGNSITSPALQTLPKGEATIRNAFIPREGHKILSSDYDQVELRLMAYFSRDKGLIDAFSGGDFFVNLARNIYKDPTFEKSDKRRGIVKAAVYATLYGGGPAKIASVLKRPEDEIKGVLSGFHSAYPGIKQFMGSVESKVMERLNSEGMAYVNLPHGRRLVCDEERVYAAVNMIIQGTAAIIFKDALVRLDNKGYGDYLLVPVHDEVVLSLPEADVADAMVEVPRLLQPITDPKGREFPVPLTADASGPLSRWGEKTG